jgi:hypothetical protein
MDGKYTGYSILIGKPDGTVLIGIPRCGWKILLKWVFGKYEVKIWPGIILVHCRFFYCDSGISTSLRVGRIPGLF